MTIGPVVMLVMLAAGQLGAGGAGAQEVGRAGMPATRGGAAETRGLAPRPCSGQASPPYETAPGATSAPTTASAPAARYVLVFDFASPGQADLGAQLADSVRLRLGERPGWKVIDGLTTGDLTPAGGVGPATPEKDIAGLLKDKAAAHVALWGEVRRSGGAVSATVRCLDVSGPQPVRWEKTFTDSTERAQGLIARQVVEALTGGAEWIPPQYGDEPEPKDFAKPLNVNGDFESGKAGWAGPDNVSSFLVDDPRPGRRGKCLRVFTDLDREAWLAYQRDLRLGRADPDKPPEIGTVANKYATVAGLEGVHYRSDWLPAAPRRRYWLVADMKGKTTDFFFPKIFVKGFADFSAQADGLSEVSLKERNLTPEGFAALDEAARREMIADDARRHPDRYRREVYRWYLSCRNEQDRWQHYAAPFPPRGGLPDNVQFLRIEVYAYWPPGEYFFDDVHLYADPRQTAPLPPEPPRTPGLTTTRP